MQQKSFHHITDNQKLNVLISANDAAGTIYKTILFNECLDNEDKKADIFLDYYPMYYRKHSKYLFSCEFKTLVKKSIETSYGEEHVSNKI